MAPPRTGNVCKNASGYSARIRISPTVRESFKLAVPSDDAAETRGALLADRAQVQPDDRHLRAVSPDLGGACHGTAPAARRALARDGDGTGAGGGPQEPGPFGLRGNDRAAIGPQIAPPIRIERTTFGLGNRCSIH